MNLQLAYMKRALADVQSVFDTYPDIKTRKAYGGLCHKIPVLVLTNGLGLTAALVQANATSELPYRLIKEHMARVLGPNQNPNLATRIGQRSSEGYMLDTFTILDAWVYYKRFAVSILGVEHEDSDAAPDPQAGGQ